MSDPAPLPSRLSDADAARLAATQRKTKLASLDFDEAKSRLGRVVIEGDDLLAELSATYGVPASALRADGSIVRA